MFVLCSSTSISTILVLKNISVLKMNRERYFSWKWKFIQNKNMKNTEMRKIKNRNVSEYFPLSLFLSLFTSFFLYVFPSLLSFFLEFLSDETSKASLLCNGRFNKGRIWRLGSVYTSRVDILARRDATELVNFNEIILILIN